MYVPYTYTNTAAAHRTHNTIHIPTRIYIYKYIYTFCARARLIYYSYAMHNFEVLGERRRHAIAPLRSSRRSIATPHSQRRNGWRTRRSKDNVHLYICIHVWCIRSPVYLCVSHLCFSAVHSMMLCWCNCWCRCCWCWHACICFSSAGFSTRSPACCDFMRGPAYGGRPTLYVSVYVLYLVLLAHRTTDNGADTTNVLPLISLSGLSAVDMCSINVYALSPS